MFPSLAGCGYMIGGQYPKEFRTIYVPTFTTETFRRGFETQLTEAVHKQIEARTPFQIVGGNSADTVLTGHIRRIDKRPTNQNRFDDPRELEISLAVDVHWVNNRTGEPIFQRQLGAPAALNQLVGDASFAPEAGQSLATATQQAVDDLGRRIVGMMEGTW
ncbi:MAG: LPS assembly lipoprotein LptE [Planctomycetaceae bacterium]